MKVRIVLALHLLFLNFKTKLKILDNGNYQVIIVLTIFGKSSRISLGALTTNISVLEFKNLMGYLLGNMILCLLYE